MVIKACKESKQIGNGPKTTEILVLAIKNVCVKDITYELDANTSRKYVMLYWY